MKCPRLFYNIGCGVTKADRGVAGYRILSKFGGCHLFCLRGVPARIADSGDEGTASDVFARDSVTNLNSEMLAELRGFFTAFEWVNGKTNHGYSFNIGTAPKSSNLEADIESHFAASNPIKLTSTKAVDWRELLSSSLARWLFAYLTDHPAIGRLTDESKTFSLSFPSFRTDMVDLIVGQGDCTLSHAPSKISSR